MDLNSILFNNRFIDPANWSIRRFVSVISKSVVQGSTIIDIGAGDCRYMKYFNNCNYIATDYSKNEYHQFSNISIVCPAENVPLPDNHADYILCTQVLEHVDDPKKTFGEFSRLLKPGGKLFLTCPQTWQEHEIPYDYHRFTSFALEKYAKDNSFEVIQIKPQCGRFVTLGYFFAESFAAYFYSRNKSLQIDSLTKCIKILTYPIVFMIGFLSNIFDRLDARKLLTLNYECIMIKKIINV